MISLHAKTDAQYESSQHSLRTESSGLRFGTFYSTHVDINLN